MSLVLKAEFTLGQLIAFRIISGNVTSPLLQLSTLYQGFQAVQLSMERLSDIIDQPPELKNELDLNQIALPPISGDVSFRNVSFRFANSGLINSMMCLSTYLLGVLWALLGKAVVVKAHL